MKSGNDLLKNKHLPIYLPGMYYFKDCSENSYCHTFVVGKGDKPMDTMWEKIKKGLKDGATLSMEKIEEYTKIGKLKVEELAAKRKITRNFIDIGERAFDLIEESKGSTVESDLAVKTSMENIKALRQELIELDKKIKAIQEASKKTDTASDEDEEITGI